MEVGEPFPTLEKLKERVRNQMGFRSTENFSLIYQGDELPDGNVSTTFYLDGPGPHKIHIMKK